MVSTQLHSYYLLTTGGSDSSSRLVCHAVRARARFVVLDHVGVRPLLTVCLRAVQRPKKLGGANACTLSVNQRPRAHKLLTVFLPSSH